MRTNIQKRQSRIGIYAGAFDPVHAGHIAFALQALLAADLDEIVFMPERRPRQKPGVEHYAHRVAMLKRALKPHPRLSVLEVVERHFTVSRTFANLQAMFPDARLVLLFGSDAVASLPAWRHAAHMITHCEFVIGLRDDEPLATARRSIAAWNPRLEGVTFLDCYAPDVSSTQIRQALRSNRPAKGLLASVRRYARREWLYVSPGQHKA